MVRECVNNCTKSNCQIHYGGFVTTPDRTITVLLQRPSNDNHKTFTTYKCLNFNRHVLYYIFHLTLDLSPDFRSWLSLYFSSLKDCNLKPSFQRYLLSSCSPLNKVFKTEESRYIVHFILSEDPKYYSSNYLFFYFHISLTMLLGKLHSILQSKFNLYTFTSRNIWPLYFILSYTHIVKKKKVASFHLL